MVGVGHFFAKWHISESDIAYMRVSSSLYGNLNKLQTHRKQAANGMRGGSTRVERCQFAGHEHAVRDPRTGTSSPANGVLLQFKLITKKDGRTLKGAAVTYFTFSADD